MIGGASSPPPTSTGSSSRAPSGTDEATVVAVASRDRSRAEAFAREHGIERAHGSYEALLEDPDVDAVYIPLPNSMHVPWSVRALEAGKHVLCEKPMTRRAAEAEEAFAAAERAGRVLEEAFMWRHHPQTQRLRELLDAGVIGQLRLVQASFSLPLDRRRRHPHAAGARRRLADGRRLLLPERRAAGGGRRARARVRASRCSAVTASTSCSRRRCASPAR